MSDVMQDDNGKAQAQPEQEVDWLDLRAEREARGLSLGQVSAQLKLTPRQIEAIERGDLSALPGSAFSRGFVRNYARFLQLDPAPFLELIDAGEGREPVGISSPMYSPGLGRMPSPGNSRLSALPAVLVVLLLACLLGLGWSFHWFEAREDVALLDGSEQLDPDVEVLANATGSVPAAAVSQEPVSGISLVPAPSALLSAPVAQASAAPVSLSDIPSVAVVAGQSAPVTRQVTASSSQSNVSASRPSMSAPVTASQPALGGLPRIVLGFEGESWVEVRDATDKVVFARLNQAGVVQEVQGSAPFVLVIGNAPKVKLSWKGKPVDLAPYTKGDVARLTVQ
ncbi:DUF4115 domain-containing protein [Uliginosibacterium sp. 31-16]|uniref:helix-turn-helix domain-containing protein n=1 Tax=Uliginosibacterium sp. 31-16 TaxID=3068315 RepID=UPI00273F9C84|nr:RodZ domain-containing protein [Uliginosibacterium sp. 31-16]MDP5241007.1 DUF4115 domain-containing protein [Uliginosibacterium sp. 31-16]